MTAQEALEQTEKYWLENEDQALKYISGFQQRIEEAANKGQVHATSAVCPVEFVPFCIMYFERLGYFVQMQQVSATDWAINVDWHILPSLSRFYKEQKDFLNTISFSENEKPLENKKQTKRE